MSDCVTVSDATILYCSDIECTENTCYADQESTLYATVGAATHEHSNQQLDNSSSSPAAAVEQYSEYHDYDEPQVLLDNGYNTPQSV